MCQKLNFAKAMSDGFLSETQPAQLPEYSFEFNVPHWLESQENQSLEQFIEEEKFTLQFSRSDEYYSYLGDLYDQFGRDSLGRGKVMIRIPMSQLWPAPIAST